MLTRHAIVGWPTINPSGPTIGAVVVDARGKVQLMPLTGYQRVTSRFGANPKAVAYSLHEW